MPHSSLIKKNEGGGEKKRTLSFRGRLLERILDFWAVLGLGIEINIPRSELNFSQKVKIQNAVYFKP